MERNVRLEWVDPSTLTPNPQNWRRHPEHQRRGVRGLIDEGGWAGVLLYNEQTGRLVDGHLRAGYEDLEEVPVLVGSWTAEQEAKILAFLDPLTALAQMDRPKMRELILGVAVEEETALARLKEDLARDAQVPTPDAPSEFSTRDETVSTNRQCPRCGYEWSEGEGSS
jgi:hypothetical protein